jgi:choline dehydrogenase/4-pyridoxate dehydrogenase
VLLRPESRGAVSLESTDPRVPPKIGFDFLSRDVDRRTLRAGIRLIRDLASQRALTDFVADEIAPGLAVQSDADLDAHIGATSATAHHPMGTCRMGATGDADAVVDDELRVIGIARLRVVDASVMPDAIGGNINAAVIMIAEKAADLVRGVRAGDSGLIPTAQRVHEVAV